MSNISQAATRQRAANATAGSAAAVLDFPARPRRRRPSKASASRGVSAEVIELCTAGEQNRRKRIEMTKFSVINAALSAKQAVCAVALFLDCDGTAHYMMTGIEPEFADILVPAVARVHTVLSRHAAKVEACDERS